MEFNSEVPDRKAPVAQLEPVLELLRVMLRNPVTHVFNKDGSVKSVEVPKDAVNSLPKEFKNELSPKKLGEELKQLHEILPNKAITKGDTWVRNQKANFGSGQTMTFRVDFKYDGTVKKEAIHWINEPAAQFAERMLDKYDAQLREAMGGKVLKFRGKTCQG